MVYNECDSNTMKPKMLRAECKLRSWAKIYPNAYIIGIFACCRQLFSAIEDRKFISKAEANKRTDEYFIEEMIKELETKEASCKDKIKQLRDKLEAKRVKKVLKLRLRSLKSD